MRVGVCIVALAIVALLAAGAQAQGSRKASISDILGKWTKRDRRCVPFMLSGLLLWLHCWFKRYNAH